MTPYFGLDIGSSSIKATKSNLLGSKQFLVEANGLVMNPAGSVDFTNPEVVVKLAPAVKNLLSEAKIKDKRVVVSVAESRVYSRILVMPQMTEAELSSAIKWEAEQFVPIPVSEVELDFSILEQQIPGSTDKKMLVYLVAAPKNYLQAMVNALTGFGLEPIAVESEMVAVSRSLTFGTTPGTSLILHMGAMSSVLAIVDGMSLSFSYVTESGGVSLTRALSQSLSLPLPQAEEYKRTYGLEPDKLEGKVKLGLQMILDNIVSEMRKAMEYHLSSRKSGITRIILSGGGAYLPYFSGYLSEVFGGIEVVVGDPFYSAKAGKGVAIPRERASFAVSVGLSQRVF